MSDLKGRLKSYSESAKRKEKASELELAFILQETIETLKEIAPIKRRPWIEAQLHELYSSQDGKCAICGKEIIWKQFHVDHRVPHSKGGGNEFSNLQLTHPFCNQSKSNGVPLSELLIYLEGRAMNI
jgi:5-methylcytosine-specific restriction endonuclease McrA